ncbi:hypothetical protein KTGMC3_P1442 [Methanocalculus sp. MC3]
MLILSNGVRGEEFSAVYSGADFFREVDGKDRGDSAKSLSDKSKSILRQKLSIGYIT